MFFWGKARPALAVSARSSLRPTGPRGRPPSVAGLRAKVPPSPKPPSSSQRALCRRMDSPVRRRTAPIAGPPAKWPRQARLSDKEACAQNKNAEGTLPSAFLFYTGDIRSKVRCARTARHTHQKQEEEGTMPSSSCFPGPRAVVRSPPSSGGDQRPHLKKVFWKGVRGRTFWPQKVSPASLPSSHTIAVQRRCCPCRSCRRAG